MIHYLYLGSIILSILIVLLIINDIKKINYKLYVNLNDKIYLKLFSMISIIFIHVIWLFNVFLTNNNNSYNLIYGLPSYLILPYLIIIYSYINKEEYKNLTMVSKIVDKIFYYLFMLYFIGVIIVIIIPNNIKKDFIDLIIKILNVYIFSKFMKNN